MVWPAGSVTVAIRGEVLPPLWNAVMISFAAVSPGWPGSEKLTVIRFDTVPVTAPPATAMIIQPITMTSRCRSTSSPQRRMVVPLRELGTI